MVGPENFEISTFGLKARYSASELRSHKFLETTGAQLRLEGSGSTAQLSSDRKQRSIASYWYTVLELNQRPSASHADILPLN